MSAPARLVVLLAMVAFGVAVYLGAGPAAGARRGAAAKPTTEKPRVSLSGTLYLAQGGSLYRLSNGQFSQLAAPAGKWSQPALLPDGSALLAVKRGAESSDLYALNPDGSVRRQLTHNASSVINRNHWVFYPRPSTDGKSIYYSFDSSKIDYKVDLAVWEMAVDGTVPRRRSTPNDYTGGDAGPVPLANGGFIYAKYGFNANVNAVSQVWLQLRPLSVGVALTNADEDCGHPALSPDGAHLAMICTHAGQASQLVSADFDGQKLGPTHVLVDSGQPASPAWSPDGTQVAFLAPAEAQGRFQLWTADSRGHVQRVTDNLDLDAPSAPAWGR